MVRTASREEIGIPFVAFVSRIEAKDRKGRGPPDRGGWVRRLVEAPIPVVASIVSDDTNVPRSLETQGHHGGSPQDGPGVDGGRFGSRPVARRPRRPTVGGARRDVGAADTRCELVNGETAEEQAERLAMRLRELKVI